MKYLRYRIISICLLATLAIRWSVDAAVWVPPSYEDNFSRYLTEEVADKEWRVETVYELWIDSSKSLKENIRCLFYPNSYMVPWCNSSSTWWQIRDVFRYIGFWVLVIYLTMIWITLLIEWRESEKVTWALKSLYYILYGSFLFFGVTWILWWVLSVETLQGTEWFVDAVQWWPDSLLFKVLTTLKTLAFFIAIIMIVVYGFRIMAVSDQADKSKTLIRWIINVVIALVLVKVIDYIYYIAQLPSFTTQATDFIIEIAKILWFILGAAFVLMIFYAWFLMITDQWKTENMKKAQNIIVGVLLSAFVIFMLLLIIYQIFAEFA